MISGDPIAQASQNQISHNRIVAIQSIAATAEIVIIAVGRQDVISFVVNALE